MKTSAAMVFRGAEQPLEACEFEVPQPRAGEVIVRVLACTLCGSDVHTFLGRRSTLTPTILGHEIVGQIVALDEAAPKHDLAGRPLQLGDRVTWAIVASCGACFYCQRAVPQKCLRAVKYGHEPLRAGQELLGGLAEYCLLVRGTAIVRLPDDLPLEVVCPASCATATVVAAFEAAGRIADRTVCVLGAGMLGLTACAMAKARGAAGVIAIDPDLGRRDRALAFGATHVAAPDDAAAIIAKTTEGHGADVVLELSGSPAAFENAWPLTRIGATTVLVGSVFPSRPVPLNLEQVVRRQQTLRGVHNYAPQHLLAAVEFLGAEAQAFPFAELVGSWSTLQDAAAAFAKAADSQNIRVGIRCELG